MQRVLKENSIHDELEVAKRCKNYINNGISDERIAYNALIKINELMPEGLPTPKEDEAIKLFKEQLLYNLYSDLGQKFVTHSLNMLDMGQNIGASNEELSAYLFHDVGKIAVDPKVLYSKERFVDMPPAIRDMHYEEIDGHAPSGENVIKVYCGYLNERLGTNFQIEDLFSEVEIAIIRGHHLENYSEVQNEEFKKYLKNIEKVYPQELNRAIEIDVLESITSPMREYNEKDYKKVENIRNIMETTNTEISTTIGQQLPNVLDVDAMCAAITTGTEVKGYKPNKLGEVLSDESISKVSLEEMKERREEMETKIQIAVANKFEF